MPTLHAGTLKNLGRNLSFSLSLSRSLSVPLDIATLKVVGFNSLPMPGDEFTMCRDSKLIKIITGARKRISKDLVDVSTETAKAELAVAFVGGTADPRAVTKIPIVIKCDSLGSLETVRRCAADMQVADDSTVCQFDIVHGGVGAVAEFDLTVASAAKATVVSFGVGKLKRGGGLSKYDHVEVNSYDIIYNLLNDLSSLLQSQSASGQPPTGNLIGKAAVKKVFSLAKIGKIAGCEVTEGMFVSNAPIRVMRAGISVISNATVATLQMGKAIAQEVSLGEECGVGTADPTADFMEGDIIECYSLSSPMTA
jgi:translation initiation factor IF-2